jgi:hypothetical protein
MVDADDSDGTVKFLTRVVSATGAGTCLLAERVCAISKSLQVSEFRLVR